MRTKFYLGADKDHILPIMSEEGKGEHLCRLVRYDAYCPLCDTLHIFYCVHKFKADEEIQHCPVCEHYIVLEGDL